MVLPPRADSSEVRKHLSADALYALVGRSFAQVPDPRRPGSPIPLGDALMSAFALFALKDPSLLAFDHRRGDGNLKALFGIGQIPSDTQMRDILDEVDPERLRDSFGDVFRQLQRGKALEPFVFYGGAYLLSLDGTGYFSSPTIHCDSCQVKEHRDGSVTYQHQMLGAVIVHPEIKEVIPLAPEPIQKRDGESKNDCERNAAKRLLPKIRRQHPHLKFIVVEDGLEDRERNLQHAEQPGRSLRAQLRARTAKPVGGLRHADDAGLSRGPGPTTLLSAVSGGVGEVGEQACLVGQPAIPFPPFPLSLDATPV
jgi:hypothetical protein